MLGNRVQGWGGARGLKVKVTLGTVGNFTLASENWSTTILSAALRLAQRDKLYAVLRLWLERLGWTGRAVVNAEQSRDVSSVPNPGQS